jgi:hypothetical protein
VFELLGDTLIPSDLDIFRVTASGGWDLTVKIIVSGWLLIFLLLAGLATILAKARLARGFRAWKAVELEINLGHVGKVKLCPEAQERQIAHCIWTELITRKAAQPIDLENDVIVEIYDSWYSIFKVVRQHVSDICALDLPTSDSKRMLVEIATQTLNDGLRPHLTRWQARIRHWLSIAPEDLKKLSPQEQQRTFPQYRELADDLLRVNRELIEYASQLKKLVDSK